MFGYIMANHNTLEKADNDCYQALYCGLCKRLDTLHGMTGRMTLTYDMVFISMLLSSLYREDESTGVQKCLVHPFRSHEYIYSRATDYAADLSIVLAYYKCLDDWYDDHNVIARNRSRALQKSTALVRTRWPRQCSAIGNGIADLREMERINEMNPDIPANRFGAIMGELFVREEDAHSPALRRMGTALGRFIYLMDAVNDLRGDIKHERYNPLVSLTNTDFAPTLTLLIGECTKEYETLPLERNISLMRNILFSGVWMKYRSKEQTE